MAGIHEIRLYKKANNNLDVGFGTGIMMDSEREYKRREGIVNIPCMLRVKIESGGKRVSTGIDGGYGMLVPMKNGLSEDIDVSPGRFGEAEMYFKFRFKRFNLFLSILGCMNSNINLDSTHVEESNDFITVSKDKYKIKYSGMSTLKGGIGCEF